MRNPNMQFAIICIFSTILLCLSICTITTLHKPQKNTSTLHEIFCINNDLDAQLYIISIPSQVTNKEVYAKGFCDSL